MQILDILRIWNWRQGMYNDKQRQFRQELKKLMLKKVNIFSVSNIRFCKYGRIQMPRSREGFGIVIPINGNQNSMYGV